MANMSHIYLTAHGDYAPGGTWAGEKAQIGIRIFSELTASAPSKGAVFSPSVGGAVDTVTDTVAGTNGTLAQNWQAMGGNPATGIDWTKERQADLADDFWVFLNAIKAYTTSSFRWTHCKIAPILTDGKYGAPSSVYTFTTALAGTASPSTALPPEVSLAVSFRAPILGRRGRGRFYLPALGTGMLATDGVVSSTPSGTIRTAAKTLVDNLQSLTGGPYTYLPIVGVTSAGATTAVRPFDVRIGNHFDMQKRRQDQVSESYLITTL